MVDKNNVELYVMNKKGMSSLNEKEFMREIFLRIHFHPFKIVSYGSMKKEICESKMQ